MGGTRARTSGIRLAALVTSALVAPGAALAQTGSGARPAEQDAAVSEVVVTAQKRTQNLQDVPISIQALDTKKLDQLQVQNFEEYVRYLPSVSISGSNPGFNPTVVVRGIATDGGNIASGSLPTVGIYLDEQPITTIDGAPDIHIYDIARVEQLSGPQGTLFGASSLSGTLRIITNKPDPKAFSAGYDLESNKYTAGGFGGQAEGFINQPLNDKAALRVVGYYDRDGGFIDNLPASRTYRTSGVTVDNSKYVGKNYNTVDTAGGRAELSIKLNEDWTIMPSVIGQYQYRNGSFSYLPTAGDLKTVRFDKEYGRDQWVQAGLTITGKLGHFDVTYAGSYLDRVTNTSNDYADYSYFYDELNGSGAYIVDNSGKYIDPTQTFYATNNFKKLSQEFRVASPATDRLRGVAGVFYQRQVEDFQLDYHIEGLNDVAVPGLKGTPVAVGGHPDTYFLTREKRIDRDFALFSQLDFDLTKKLTLTAGARYYRYDNTLVGFFGYGPTGGGFFSSTGTRGCIGPAVVQGTPCTNLGVLNSDGSVSPREVQDDGFTFRFNATYKLTPNNLIYATVSDGFRPGGTNRIGDKVTGQTIPYGADHLTNYEIGSKNTFWNRRGTFNVTVFDQEWKDIQLTLVFNGVGLIQNGAGARSRGAEVSASLNPLPGLSLTSAASYTDAYLTKDYFFGKTLAAPKGETLPFTPAFKGNVVGRYVWSWNGVQMHAQVAETYQSSSWNNFQSSFRSILGRRNAFGTTDIAFGGERGGKTFEAYVSNLFDRRGINQKGPECNITYCGNSKDGNIYVNTVQPRLVGVRFGQRF